MSRASSYGMATTTVAAKVHHLFEPPNFFVKIFFLRTHSSIYFGAHKPFAVTEHHENQNAAVNNLPHVGGDGIGHTDETQGFGQQDKESGGKDASPQSPHAADDEPPPRLRLMHAKCDRRMTALIFAGKRR